LAIDGDENEVGSGRAQGDFGKAEKHRVGHNGFAKLKKRRWTIRTFSFLVRMCYSVSRSNAIRTALKRPRSALSQRAGLRGDQKAETAAIDKNEPSQRSTQCSRFSTQARATL